MAIIFFIFSLSLIILFSFPHMVSIEGRNRSHQPLQVDEIPFYNRDFNLA